MPDHYLRPLLAARSIALVGATEREGALGNIVHRNLAAGGLRGELYAVNPKHRTIFGQRAYPRLSELPQPPDLAVIVTPARTVPQIIEDAGAAGVKAAVILSSGFAEAGAGARAWDTRYSSGCARQRAPPATRRCTATSWMPIARCSNSPRTLASPSTRARAAR